MPTQYRDPPMRLSRWLPSPGAEMRWMASQVGPPVRLRRGAPPAPSLRGDAPALGPRQVHGSDGSRKRHADGVRADAPAEGGSAPCVQVPPGETAVRARDGVDLPHAGDVVRGPARERDGDAPQSRPREGDGKGLGLGEIRELPDGPRRIAQEDPAPPIEPGLVPQ